MSEQEEFFAETNTPRCSRKIKCDINYTMKTNQKLKPKLSKSEDT